LQEFQRPLTAEERSSFQQQLENGSQKLKKTQTLFLIAVATGSSGLISLTAGIAMNKHATNTAFWPFLIFLGAAPISALLFDAAGKNRRQAETLKERFQRIVRDNSASVLHVVSTAVIAIQEEEWEDYLFQVDPKMLFYFDSLEYYGTTGFPNSDFELIGYQPHAWVKTVKLNGHLLKPVTRFSSDEKHRLRSIGKLPEPDALFAGTIEELRSYLEEQLPRGARTSGQEDPT
jgi:hypothetical protein